MLRHAPICAGLVALTLVVPCLAGAQEGGQSADTLASSPLDEIKPQGAPLTPDEEQALGRALLFDTTDVAHTPPTKALKIPKSGQPPGLAVTSNDKSDGTGTLSLKQPLSTDFDAKIGADLNVAAAPPVTYEPNGPLPGSGGNASTGSAWASLGVIDNLASIDARVTAGTEEGKLGTTLQRSMPIGGNFSVTLHDTYSITDSLATQSTAPAGLPIRTLPQQSSVTAAPDPVWSNDRGVKFNILPTGTALSAGLSSVSTDTVTHNTLSAEQRLYGPLHVTTSVSDLGQTTENKSITAGVKLNW